MPAEIVPHARVVAITVGMVKGKPTPEIETAVPVAVDVTLVKTISTTSET